MTNLDRFNWAVAIYTPPMHTDYAREEPNKKDQADEEYIAESGDYDRDWDALKHHVPGL